jgi:signal transduction histidine kinase
MFIRGFKRSIPVGLLIYPPSSIGEGQLLFYNRPTRQKKAYLLGYEEGDLRIKCQAITGRKRRHCKKSNYTEYLTFFRAPKAILHMRVFFCSLWLILNLNDSVCKAQSDSISYWVESGIKLFEEGDFESSREIFQKARIKAKENSEFLVEISNNLGNIAGYQGKPEEAIAHYQDALKNVRYAKDPLASESAIRKNIAATYSDLKDFSNSFKYLLEAEELARQGNRADLIADCLNNKGILYEQTDSIPQALQVYEEARRYYRSVNDIERLALVNVNIGVVAKNLSKLDEALMAYDSALYFASQIPNAFYESVILNNRGNVLSKLGRNGEAIETTKKALDIARMLGQMNLVQDCLESLADQYAAGGNYQMAFLHQQEFNALKDSLINAERISALSEMETKYEVEKKELRLTKLQAENLLIEKEKTRMGIYASVLVIILILIVVVAFIRQQILKLKQHKKELQIIAQTEKQERERIAKDMHDELGSGISRITWITAAAQKHVLNEGTMDSFNHIEQISVQLAHGMRSLIWLLNTGSTEWEKFVAMIRELTGQQTEEKNIAVHITGVESAKGKTLKPHAARDLMLLIKETVHNSVKYSGATTIGIHFYQQDNHFSIAISDNGIGFDVNAVHTGNGLTNIQVRARNLKGNSQIISSPGQGTKIRVELLAEEIFS